MENESEMIRHQMDETRTAMTDKIETLEQQVVETVQAASAAMSETVQTVKDSVHDTVETVKDTFDLPRQVNRRPWTMVAGATALGYLGGYLLSRSKGSETRPKETSRSIARDVQARHATHGNGAAKGRVAAKSAALREPDPAPVDAAEGPGWGSNLGDTFQAEISQLEKLAVGTLLGIVRDLVTDAAPDSVEHQVADFVNGITVKLGGQPVDGRVLPEPARMDG